MMDGTRTALCAAFLMVGTVSANAGFFDTIGNVADTANRIADAQKDLSEGRLPVGAMKGGGEKGGGKGKHSSGGHHHK